MNPIISELIFMGCIFFALTVITVGTLLVITKIVQIYAQLKKELDSLNVEQVIGALMLIGLVILFMFYGPIIMF